MKNKKALLLFSIFAIIFLVGCQQQGQERVGFDINIIPGAGFVSGGENLLEGEPFKIGLDLVNYDAEEKKGNVCIYDDINDFYGGIQQRECKAFFVSGSAKVQEQQIPGEQKIYFPTAGSYSYTNLPTDFKAAITIETQYFQDAVFSQALTYPSPETETISFGDKFISLKAEKSVHASSQDSYEIFFKINLNKIGNAVIESENKNNTLRFSIAAQPLLFDCKTSKQQFSQSALIDLEKENFISCSALTTSREQESLPLIIKLNYVAKEEKKINVNIMKR